MDWRELSDYLRDIQHHAEIPELREISNNLRTRSMVDISNALRDSGLQDTLDRISRARHGDFPVKSDSDNSTSAVVNLPNTTPQQTLTDIYSAINNGFERLERAGKKQFLLGLLFGFLLGIAASYIASLLP